MSKQLYVPCVICGKKATWSYMPSDENYCDDHVPRGCSCNCNEKGAEELDEQGRKKPCCEYWIISSEDHEDTNMASYGWEAYFRHHPEERIESVETEYWEDKLGIE